MGKRIVVLAVAVLLAGLAALAVWQVLSNAEDAAQEGLTIVPVYRAVVLIPEGTLGIQANANQWFTVDEELEKFVPENAITTPEDLETFITGDGIVAAGPISARSVLTSDQWTQSVEDLRPLALVIPRGKQAMTIAASGANGVNGMIEPGDRINMIVTGTIELIGFEPTAGLSELSPDETEGQAGGATDTDGDGVPDLTLNREAKQVSRYVLQGLNVLAVGKELIPDPEAPVEVTVQSGQPGAGEAQAAPTEDGTRGLLTLEVTPDQAERIAYTYNFGSVWLTLNPTGDFQPAETEGVVIENLFADFGILTVLFPELADLEELLGGN